MHLLNINFFIFFFAASLPAVCTAQKKDTLQTVIVLSARKTINIAASPAPVQVLYKEDIDRRNSLSVADAVKYFAGISVKDYGGIGGLKTVSVRSLGANHTGVMYDGLVLGDAQGGQTDLGKFSLDNLQEIQLYNEGPSNLLSPARAFSFSSVLSLKTTSSNFKESEKSLIAITLKKGSFGYFSPAIYFKTHIGKKFKTGLNAFFQNANGRYPFLSYENNHLSEKRNNTDINAYRFEYDAAYGANDSNSLNLKIYYAASNRGLPGAIILYNSISNQRLKDDVFFIQSTRQKHINSKNSILLSAKYSRDNNYYTDPSYPNSYGKLENNFHQQELYLSGVYKYSLNKFIGLSYGSDVYRSKLNRTDIFAVGFANPVRNNYLNNIAFQLKKPRYETFGNILYTVLNEKVSAGKPGRNLREFSTAFSGSVKPFNDLPIRIRGFYKHVFRAPTFNDLYYTNIGNVNLRPEFADQYNLGITFNSNNSSFFSRCIFTLDGYINSVRDKIIAVPRQNLFQWSMQNIGKASIHGADAALHLALPANVIQLSSDFSYSFQQASDVTDKTSDLYKTQLPYTPKHSGSVNLNAAYKKAVLSYNILMSGERYRAGSAVPENIVQGWSSNDISMSYLLGNKVAQYKIVAEANNIFNTQYEVIRYYPMPRFNYRLSVTASIKK